MRKLKDIGIHNIGEQESWLQDMALEGLFIQKAGPLFCRFKKGDPVPMNYRLIPVADMPMTSKMKKESAQSGWDFVTEYGFFFLYSSPVSSNAEEWHLSPADYGKKLRRLGDRALAVALALVAYLIFFSFGLYNSFSALFSPYSDLLGAELVSPVLLIVFGIILLINAMFKLKIINALKKSLSTGNPIDHHAPWRKKRAQNRLKAGIFCALFIFVLAFPFTQKSVYDAPMVPLPADTDALPIVRLATIETSPDLMRYQGEEADDERDNSYARVSSLLAPVQILSDERGIVPNKTRKDTDIAYMPSIENTIYKLAFSCMTDKFLRDWASLEAEVTLRLDEKAALVELNNSHFDTLILLDWNYGFRLYAAKGRVLIGVSYFGDADTDMDAVIQAVADNITQLSR